VCQPNEGAAARRCACAADSSILDDSTQRPAPSARRHPQKVSPGKKLRMRGEFACRGHGMRRHVHALQTSLDRGSGAATRPNR
jgi:hypothetical protein